MGSFNSRNDGVAKVRVLVDEARDNFFFQREDVPEDVLRSWVIPGHFELVEVLLIFNNSGGVD